MTIVLELPPAIERRTQTEAGDWERLAREGFVVEAFRQGKISSGEAAQLLGLPDRMQAISFLSKRGVYPGYDVEDLEQDVRTLDRLFAK